MRRFPLFALALPFMFVSCVSSSKYKMESDRAAALEKQVAQLNTDKATLTEAVNNANKAAADEIARLQSERNREVNQLRAAIESEQVKVTEMAGRLSINMVDKILFPSGSAKLKPEGEAVLVKIADAVKQIPDRRLMVSGHTDNVRISSVLRERFPTNWELSTARATAVVRFLQEKAEVPGEKMIAAGQGEFAPIADNSTPEGRDKNRRIEILLIPDQETLQVQR